MMLPMLLGSGMAIVSANSSGVGTSAFMYTGIITAVSSALIGVMWALLNMRYAKKQIKEEELLRFNAYRDYLVKIADQLNNQYRENANKLNDRYPSSEACLHYGPDPTRLWSRNFTHSDFLFVRLGMGSMPFQVPIQVPKERFTLVDDSLSEKPRQIYESFSTLRNVPVGVDLKATQLWGIYGDGNLSEGMAIARSMAIQIAANNCYTDVKMVFLYEKQYERDMSFAKWLPHVWSEDKKVRYVASDKNEVNDVLYALGSNLRIRAEQDNKRDIPRPHYVVFVCNPDLLEGEPAAKFLLEPSPELGISTVLIAHGYEALPNSCTNLIQQDAQFHGFYDVSTVDAKKRAVVFDKVLPEEAEHFARWLSGIRVNELESGGELPNSISFFDMYGVQSLPEFSVQDRWRKNRTYENMRALVGRKAGGANLYLDIHEKYHGPHGLVAGTTGSGKSETLQTYILSLALNFSPLDVGFFIIDYKGGGMANLFSGLPHMLGQISNLSGNQVRRAMVSIKSEIKRRQRIFGEYDVNHLDQYTRLLKNGEASVPIPHLVIVIDNEEVIKGQIKELVRGSVEETLNELLEAEAEKLTQAARYERNEQRQGYRSGHYNRNLTTTSGDVTLKEPKLKGISFETAIIERYRRRESSVEEALIEMYLAGVSVRRVEDITEALWGSKVSPSTISELNKKAYVHIEDWRNRPLQGGRYPYVYVDGIYLRRNWGGEFENVAILVAIAVNEDGYREVLGAAEGMKEDKSSWVSFFQWLRGRGLDGVKLIVGDKCLGMLEAVGEVFPEAKYQRCTVHFYRNVFSVTPRSKVKLVAKMLKAVHAQESKKAAREKAKAVVEELRSMKLKEAAKKVEDGIEETLTYCDFPSEHWTRIRTNNVIERLNREIRRRTRVVGSFPDGNSALMLVCARLRHVAGTQWGNKKYMNMKHLEAALEDASIAG